jgi:hypothetical protein
MIPSHAHPEPADAALRPQVGGAAPGPQAAAGGAAARGGGADVEAGATFADGLPRDRGGACVLTVKRAAAQDAGFDSLADTRQILNLPGELSADEVRPLTAPARPA